MDDLILIHFQKIPLPALHALLTYIPIATHHEPETRLCTRYLTFTNPGLQLAYPDTNTTEWTMKARIADENTPFGLKPFDLFEPLEGREIEVDELDFVFVPLLAMDKNGYRVGFGKGCYDRFLAHCRPDCVKVGLSYFDPIEKIEDRGEFDVPLDFGITPGNVYAF